MLNDERFIRGTCPGEALSTMSTAGLPRVINGLWQFSAGHSDSRIADVEAIFNHYLDSGFATFDCADIYTGVEELLGNFIKKLSPERRNQVRVHTKYVPDLEALANLDRRQIETTIDRSLKRLNLESLHLVQFHWWDFSQPGYVEAALVLADLVAAGKIQRLGLTNFDTEHLATVVEAGVPVFSNQVQLSIIDRRPLKSLCQFAADRGIRLLCYGSVAGGFLSDVVLDRPDPGRDCGNRSQLKYRLIIEEMGGWASFQTLLRRLHTLAVNLGKSTAEIASSYSLSQQGVGAVIVGLRSAKHLKETERISQNSLSLEVIAAINSIRSDFPEIPGEVYELERDRTGRHGSIMRYNLNSALPGGH